MADENVPPETAEIKLARYLAEDDAAKSAAPDWVPNIEVTHRASGRWAKFGETEFPVDFIANIGIGRVGKRPCLGFELMPTFMVPVPFFYAERSNDTTIVITLFSGMEHRIIIDRWRADTLFAALIKLIGEVLK